MAGFLMMEDRSEVPLVYRLSACLAGIEVRGFVDRIASGAMTDVSKSRFEHGSLLSALRLVGCRIGSMRYPPSSRWRIWLSGLKNLFCLACAQANRLSLVGEVIMRQFPPRRRTEIDVSSPRDLMFWAGTWALTDQELADAIAAVGTVIADVAAFLGQPIEGLPPPDR